MSTAPDALPELVRARVIAYAADALGALPTDHVPGPLKRAATFTPQRRARIAGEQILELLSSDEAFRERIGVQARSRQVRAAEQLAEGAGTVDAAALAFLLRPGGWEDLLRNAGSAPAPAANDVPRLREQVDTLRARLDAATEENAAIRRKGREELVAAKAEVAELRRKLGDTRSRLRSTQGELDRRVAEYADEVARLEAESTSADAELRRVKAQVVAVEAELARAQRAVRAGREESTLRARLLLDTLLQAAQGLRQELALPVTSGAPADQVEAHLAESGARDSTATGSMRPDDPGLLRELLALPQVHLIIDGYNVTRAEWDDLSLEMQRTRLLRGVGPLAARSSAEVTVVFDGTNAEHRPVVQQPRGVRVLFSPRGILADDVVRDLVAAEPPGRPLVVVTSDQEIVRDVVRRPGVRVVGSSALARLLG
jgi:predicted RNA-binding protein with PIN domain